MKKTLILFALVAAMPLTMNAQDDMYFVPTKKNVEKSKKNFGMPKDRLIHGIGSHGHFPENWNIPMRICAPWIR